MRKFSPAQAIVIRERLIRYLVDQKRLGQLRADPQGRPIRTGTREILEDIIFSEHTSYDVPPEYDYVDDKPYDYFFELKDDGLGAFLARRQARLHDKHLTEILNFLCGEGRVSQAYLDEVYAIELIKIPITASRQFEDCPERLPILGEYLAIGNVDDGTELRSCVFFKGPRAKAVQTTHLEIKLVGDRKKDHPYKLITEKEITGCKPIFYGHGICLVSEFGPANILVFNTSGRVLHLELQISEDRQSFLDVTRGNFNFETFEKVGKGLEELLKFFPLMERGGGPIYSVGPYHMEYGLDPTRMNFHLFPLGVNQFSAVGNNENDVHEIELDYLSGVDWNREFIEACEALDFQAIVQSLALGANPFTVSSRTGNSILHWAALHGSVDLYFLLYGSRFRTEDVFDIRSFLKNLQEELPRPIEFNFKAFQSGFSTLVLLKNSMGQIASGCIQNASLSAKDAKNSENRDFFLTILSWEYKVSGMFASNFVDWLCEMANEGTVFPNISL